MKARKDFITILIGLSVVVVLGHGCRRAIEPAPFFDGLSLTYIEIFENSPKPEDRISTREIRYEFHQIQEGAFKVTEEVQTRRGPAHPKVELIAPEVGQDLTIDSDGIVLRGGDGMNFINGFPSYIWLHPKYRRNGKTVIPIIRNVRDQLSWEGWQVWAVVFGDMDFPLYYDIKTGFLVGREAANGKLRMRLKATNLKGLKVSEVSNVAGQTDKVIK